VKRPLLFAVVAAFALAGCSAAQPIAQSPTQSVVGSAGPAGSQGVARPQGPIGRAGAQGQMTGKDGWRAYRDYTFSADSNEIRRSDRGKAAEIASYLDQNPSVRVGLDGVNDENVLAVRDALITAGVPASRIRSGAFGEPYFRRDGRVAVLVSN